MAVSLSRSRWRRGVAALAVVAALGAPGVGALAQSTGVLPGGIGKTVPEGTPLLLEADRLVYNRDDQTVTARGGVQIAYGPYRLVAREVAYDQQTGRLVARGDVEIVEPDGNVIYANEIDVTDDFADGFVNGLRIETVANTRFAAESAVRGDAGNTTVFNNGVYTACETCEDDPDKPLSWRIRARTVIWDQQEREITFQTPSFELFGRPLFGLPAFTIPDHTVKRRSGFLTPSVSYSEELGAGLTIPYYLALSPTYDATLQATALSRQGVLGEAQFRRRFRSGDLEFRTAAIAQLSPGAFEAGTADDTTGRAMIGGRGDFRINERWQWGFDFLAQTDNNFSATYDIEGYDASTFVNNVYLIGLDDRAYFEIKAEQFLVQSNDLAYVNENPVVWPAFDYEKTLDTTVAGGEVTIDLSAVHLTRDRQTCLTSVVDPLRATGSRETDNCNTVLPPDRLGVRETGIDGDYRRVSGEVSWSGVYTTPQGLVFEPILAGRVDGVSIDSHANRPFGQPPITGPEQIRTMATIGGEARYPILATNGAGVHIFEPIAQLFVRPDEDLTGAIVNEDSQSLVFDASTLLERDKFAGEDRIEGGTRANLALRYAGKLQNGLSIDALVGQSFHLAGTNPYARASQTLDLVNIGAQSGLETDRSDFVGSLSVSTPDGYSVSARARLDEADLSLERGEIEASYSGIDFAAAGRYAFVESQPDSGRLSPRHQVEGATRVAINEDWTATAAAAYDFETGTVWRRGAGLEYADECFAYSLDYTENRRNLDAIERSLQFRVSLRTVGDFGADRSLTANN